MVSRKEFLKKIWGIIILPYLILALLMHRKHVAVNNTRQIRISMNNMNEITFLGDYICLKRGSAITVLSAKCPHLGCRIIDVKNESFICPCHGSAFDLEGRVIRGPASGNLNPVSFTLINETNEIVINASI